MAGMVRNRQPAYAPIKRVPGFEKIPEAERAITSQFAAIHREIKEILQPTNTARGKPTTAPKAKSPEKTITTASYMAREGEVIRARPGTGDMTVVLPQAVRENLGNRVTILLESVRLGGLTVQSAGGSLVDGNATLNITAPGKLEFISNGETAWQSESGVSAIGGKVTGGDWVDFADGRQWQGVEVGRYMADADGSLSTAIRLALARNQSAKRFVLPPGDWPVTQMTEASHGLRDNLILDGGHRDRCKLYRTTAGQMLLWSNGPSNIALRNMTFDFQNISAQFSASVNAIGCSRFTVEDCAFLCSIPDSVTGDGIRHQVQFSGSHILVRRCYFYQSQLRLSNLGESTEHASAFDNEFENCNDLGVSCVSGDGGAPASNYIRNIRIGRNKFYGTLKGSGYIYVGSDAATTNPGTMSDVDIFDNECTGEIGQLGTDLSRPSGRLGIYIVLCDVNKRLRMRNNTVANSNPAYSTPIVFGMALYLRNGSSTSTTDALIEGNSIDFQSDDTRAAVIVDGPNMVDVKVKRNTVPSGSRGFVIGACSHSDISENVMHGSTSCGLLIDSTQNAITDLRIRQNDLETQAAFTSVIQFAGNHNMTRIVAEQNRLVTVSGSSAINVLSGGATLDLAYDHNSQNAALSGTIVPTSNLDNRTE